MKKDQGLYEKWITNACCFFACFAAFSHTNLLEHFLFFFVSCSVSFQILFPFQLYKEWSIVQAAHIYSFWYVIISFLFRTGKGVKILEKNSINIVLSLPV